MSSPSCCPCVYYVCEYCIRKLETLYNFFSNFTMNFPFALLLNGVASVDTAYVNSVVDQLLGSIVELVISQEMDEMPVPEIHEEWEERRGILRLRGSFECTDGHLRSLTSIRRTGDASLVKKGDHLVIKVLLGFAELELEYARCQAKIRRLVSMTTGVKATVLKNSIDTEISLRFVRGELRPTVNHVYMAEFGKIKVHTDGLMAKIRDPILEVVVRHFHTQIRQVINEKLEEWVKKAIVQINFPALFSTR